MIALLLGLAGCTEYGFTDSRWTDVFQQDRANEVDLLVVIDNSCSMVEEQDNLARNFDALLQQFVEAEVDWRIAVTTTDIVEERFRGRLQGGDDEIILRGPQGEIDRVEYTREWGFEDGRSLFLRGQRTNAQDNDIVDNWCPSQVQYALGHFGTPGLPNPQCQGDPASPVPTGPDTGARAPRQGDLAISEIMAQSSGDDRLCEWIELTSTTDDTLLLEGLEMSDRGRNHVVFPPTTLAPRDRLVVGRSLVDNCGTPVDVAFAEGFTLNDDLRYIDGSMPDAAELFAEAVSQGTIGSGIELGFEASRLVFEAPYYTFFNDAWLRDEAKLAILYVSDEDDLSPLPVDGYLDYFSELKGLQGYRDPQMFTVSAVVGTARPPSEDAPACISDNGLGFYGERYLAAANRTGGLADSICAEDFAPIVSRLGLTLAGLRLEFGLSRKPKLDTLRVEVYEDESNDSLLAELERGVDYTYDIDANALVFTVEQAPLASTFIVARYQILPNGAEVVDPLAEGGSPDDPGALP
ncbi:MAG: lamin tail domain-containing protein [Myxococcota bacterium]